MMPDSDEVRRLVDKARKTNDRRDAIERKAGFGVPGDIGDDDLIRTAMLAILSGMQGGGRHAGDWDCIAEGYEFLVDLHFRMTGKRYDPARHDGTPGRAAV